MSVAPCSVKHILVGKSDLPVCCPPEKDALWNAHPRVYLDIETKGQVTCPYCGVHYELAD